MILVPVDGSPDASHALDYACDISKLLGAEVHVCHAASESAESDGNENGATILANARRIGRRHNVAVHSHLLHGNPVQAILRLALETHADLIVMGTHGRTERRTVSLGSVAEQMTRDSALPLLLLRDPTYDLNGVAD
ncbi:MAG TPA: universal stress protein [Candidatus Babeliales bacterium]|nr:universal stress protein [Candidatus Babeliales bacterium]